MLWELAGEVGPMCPVDEPEMLQRLVPEAAGVKPSGKCIRLPQAKYPGQSFRGAAIVCRPASRRALLLSKAIHHRDKRCPISFACWRQNSMFDQREAKPLGSSKRTR